MFYLFYKMFRFTLKIQLYHIPIVLNTFFEFFPIPEKYKKKARKSDLPCFFLRFADEPGYFLFSVCAGGGGGGVTGLQLVQGLSLSFKASDNFTTLTSFPSLTTAHSLVW